MKLTPKQTAMVEAIARGAKFSLESTASPRTAKSLIVRRLAEKDWHRGEVLRLTPAGRVVAARLVGV